MTPAPKYNKSVPQNPIQANATNAILNILSAPFLSPNANFSETSFAIALGTPIEDNVSSNAYT